MTYKTHALGGAVMGTSILTAMNFAKIAYNPIFEGIPFIIGNVLGGLINDIDKKESKIGQILWFISWPIYLVQKILSFIFGKSKSKFAKKFMATIKHRGFTHWPSVYIVFLFLIFILSKNFEMGNVIDISTEMNINTIVTLLFSFSNNILFSFFYGICMGALSHILLDSLNPTGVPLLAPFSLDRIHFAEIETTGSKTKTVKTKYKKGFERKNKNQKKKSTKEFVFRQFLNVIFILILFLYLYTF